MSAGKNSDGLDRLLLDNTEQMIFLVEPESLRIVEANRTAAQTLGYDPERLLEMSILDIESALQDIFYWEEVRNGQFAAIESQDVITSYSIHYTKLYDISSNSGDVCGFCTDCFVKYFLSPYGAFSLLPASLLLAYR